MTGMNASSRLQLRQALDAAKERFAYPRDEKWAVAGDGLGNVAIAGTDEIVVRLDTTAGRVQTAKNPSGYPFVAGEPVLLTPLRDRAPIAWLANAPLGCMIRRVVGLIPLSSSTLGPLGDALQCNFPNNACIAGDSITAGVFYNGGVNNTSGDTGYILRYEGGTLSAYAGQFVASPPGFTQTELGPALSSHLAPVFDVAVSPSGQVFFLVWREAKTPAGESFSAMRIYTVSGGTIVHVAGTRSSGGGYSGDGGPSSACQFADGSLGNIAINPIDGSLWVSDEENHVIRRIAPPLDGTGTITTEVGTGSSGYSDGPALSAALKHPGPLTFAPDGRLFFLDQDAVPSTPSTFSSSIYHRVRMLDGGQVTTIAGTTATDGVAPPGVPYAGDGTLASLAPIQTASIEWFRDGLVCQHHTTDTTTPIDISTSTISVQYFPVGGAMRTIIGNGAIMSIAVAQPIVKRARGEFSVGARRTGYGVDLDGWLYVALGTSIWRLEC